MTPIHVHVHLNHNLDVSEWLSKYEKGIPVDKTPYGFHHAEEYGAEVSFSDSSRESKPVKTLRRGLQSLLGFDIVHAWRNRHKLASCDVVWTHTELEHLAVSLLFLALGKNNEPKLISNSVWLYDRWPSLNAAKKVLYKRLLERADLLTTNATDGLEVLRTILPGRRPQYVPYGISAEVFPPRLKPSYAGSVGTVRVLSIGNDPSRDWESLYEAVGRQEGVELRVASKTWPAKFTADNIEVLVAKSADELRALYDWADLVVMPVEPNVYASGITAMLEIAASGVPMICTDTGGLRAYFSGDEVRYVPARNPASIRAAVEELAHDPAGRERLARAAQDRMVKAGYTSKDYAARLYRLSLELLSRGADRPQEP